MDCTALFMWDAIFIYTALASPLILLALAAGAAGPVVKIKVQLSLINLLVLTTTMGFVLHEIITGKDNKDA